jgi:tetratricopeptide (TPR) repeat protein
LKELEKEEAEKKLTKKEKKLKLASATTIATTFQNQENNINNTNKNQNIPAFVELEKCVTFLKSIPFNYKHVWILELQQIIDNFEYIPDEMEIAYESYLEAEQLKKEGKFNDADRKYDFAFTTQVLVLGNSIASKSNTVAETLLGKAENTFLLGSLNLSKTLYEQGISIFRKHSETNKGFIHCLFGIANIFYVQGKYEDALSSHQKVEAKYLKIFGEYSIEIVKCRVAIAYDYYKLGKYETAFEIAMKAFNVLSVIPDIHVKDDSIASIQICSAYIYIAQGLYTEAKKSIENALEIREKLYSTLEHYSLTEVYECKILYLMEINKLSDAYKLSTKSLKSRIKIFGRSNSDNYTDVNDRKSAFVEAYDNFTLDTINNMTTTDNKSAYQKHKHNTIKEDEDFVDWEESIAQQSNQLTPTTTRRRSRRYYLCRRS